MYNQERQILLLLDRNHYTLEDIKRLENNMEVYLQNSELRTQDKSCQQR
jgi:hypothetical protein